MTEPADIPVPGVHAMEHTADVGLEVQAPTLPELFRRSALGAMWLVLEEMGQEGKRELRSLELVADDLPSLLRSWLRSLLLWQETEGFRTVDSTLVLVPAPPDSAAGGRAVALRGVVEGTTRLGPAVREIKGVTLHGLQVEQAGEGWRATVIFDV